jgi:peptidoglycan hydrolase FlgJ
MMLNNNGPVSGIDITAVREARKPSKLHEAAQQFEALMVGEIMRAQREAGSEGWLGSGDDTGDDTAMEIAEAQFSNAVAAGSGLGLARMVEKAVSRNEMAGQALNTPERCTRLSVDSSGGPQLR